MHDIRGMGEQIPVSLKQKTFTRREIMFRGAEIYKEKFSNREGFISATFEIITLMAWVPALNQPKPLKPGTGKTRLVEFLNSDRLME